MNALALLLLLTVGATEQSYGPYARPAQHGNHAMAVARGGVLLAWSEYDASGRARIHVALLDSSARLISPISVLPALTPSRNAILPAIGTDGESFLVAWEETSTRRQTVGITVDAHGLPAAAPSAIDFDSVLPSAPRDTLRIAWRGDEYVVRTREGSGWRVRPDTMAAQWLTPPVPDAVAGDGAPGSASLTITPTQGWFNGYIGPPYTYAVAYRMGTRTGSESMGQTVTGTPWIAAAGNDFVVTWSVRDYLYYRLRDGIRLSFMDEVDEWSRPHAVCTAARCVIAWSTRSGDIHAVAFDPARPAVTERFTIAASARDEREAQVVLLSDTRALISYRSSGPDGERLAGRIVFFNTPKHRAAR